MVYSNEQTQIEITDRQWYVGQGTGEAGQRAPSGGAECYAVCSLSRVRLRPSEL